MESKKHQFEVEQIQAVTIIKTDTGLTVGAGTTKQVCMALAEYLAVQGRADA